MSNIYGSRASRLLPCSVHLDITKSFLPQITGTKFVSLTFAVN